MKSAYVKPLINRLQQGRMNIYGSQPSYVTKIKSHIDGVAVDELVTRFGSPLYVFSEKTLCNKVREVHQAFSSRYPNVTLAWSYKTNYLKAICAVMHEEGSLAEVVSEMEYGMARNLGIPGERIIFNGPYKPRHALKLAVDEGAMINIDHMDELHDLEEIARGRGQTIDVGMRLSLDAGIQPQWSRFGLSLETGQAREAVRRMAATGLLRLRGLHCHIGTYILDPEAYGRQVAKMVIFCHELEDFFGFTVDYLDIGGGIPSQSRLKSSYLPADISVPPVEEYAKEVSQALLQNLRPGHMPRLILECGRALVDEAGFLVSTVTASKRLPDGIRSYIADAGLNLLFTSLWYRPDIALVKEVKGVAENSVLHGPLCMNIDVVANELMLPPLERGALMVISPVGAYNNTQSQQFIHLRPAVVMISQDGGVDLIQNGETLADVTARENLPVRFTRNNKPVASNATNSFTRVNERELIHAHHQ